MVDGEPPCTFDEATHTYRLNGTPVPSVTQALKEAGLIDDRWFTPETRDRGTYVAVATKLWDHGALNEDAVRDEVRGYIEAWKRFREVSGWDILGVEQLVWNTTYSYAGTYDRLMRRTDGTVSVVDIKTGQPASWHPLQTAAYAACPQVYRQHVVIARHAIYLAGDGTFKIHHHPQTDNETDLKVFLAALAVSKWKQHTGAKA